MASRGRSNARSAVALALAAGRTQEQAAAAGGVGVRTVGRWRSQPGFQAQVLDLRDGLIAEAVGRLADGMSDAVDVLRKLLSANGETVRLGAARAILEFGLRGQEAVELAARVQELECLAAPHSEGLGHEQDTFAPPTESGRVRAGPGHGCDGVEGPDWGISRGR